MDLDDEYHLALKRWSAAIIFWANSNCPANGYDFNILLKKDSDLQKLANKCIEDQSKRINN